MPKTGRFTLEERMAVLELIKPKVSILDALTSDTQANDHKKEIWDEITKEFIKDRPDRQELTSKEIRELWRRVKHRARMDVRHAIQSAKIGHVRSVAEADNLGWLPEENAGHKVIDINDLGLEVDTKFITDFVPLLEEEATVLETRNGVLLDYKEKSSRTTLDKRRTSQSYPVLSNGSPQKLARTDLGAIPTDTNDVFEVIEVVDRILPEVKTQLNDRTSPSLEAPRNTSQADSPFGIQISSVVSQQPQFAPDTTSKSVPLHYDQRMKASTASVMNPSVKPAVNSRLSLHNPSGINTNVNLKIHPSMNSPVNSNMNTNMTATMGTATGTTKAATAMKSTCDNLTQLSIQYLKQEHEAKMELIRLEQAAAKAKSETARAKRSAYDEKRMFYFEKRKKLHENAT